MKNLTDSFVYLGHWPSAGSFGFNTDILATNPINLSVVFGVLIFFGKGVYNLLSLNDLLDNRKQRILNTIRNSEELREGAIQQLENARARLRKVEMEADQFRVNGYSEIEREKLNLINSIYKTLKQLENYKNETILLSNKEQLIKSANGCLSNELHLRTINANIGMFGTMKEITD
ncbi:ATP synthase CF0 B subunit [Arabidopsis lyrata subsp. lyrata]|uniref:ATP synthase CF0 B subunit n=1 Tax=Arabidopsis lyrata subsp. lyrata TaxID=81972 RepID=D7KRC8_ARALL|nr:ATP synthase CF0 B subunit [Arabidopsis lyrata subsp. lyrata]